MEDLACRYHRVMKHHIRPQLGLSNFLKFGMLYKGLRVLDRTYKCVERILSLYVIRDAHMTLKGLDGLQKGS
jgi:hypothetical protein